MTSTEDLISRLATDGASAPASKVRHFVLPLGLAFLFCGAILLLVLGQPFLALDLYGPVPLMVKWVFSLPLVIGGALALYALGHPGRQASPHLGALCFPFLFLGLLLAINLLTTTAPTSGASWTNCLTAMATLSPIAFAAAIIATRFLAPTRLKLAGMVAGLFGGGVAMTAYSPFCPELGMVFMLLYYVLPVIVMAVIGWFAGPRLLRW